jgi:hypothetical protein
MAGSYLKKAAAGRLNIGRSLAGILERHNLHGIAAERRRVVATA